MTATPGEISDEIRNQRMLDGRAKARDDDFRRSWYGPGGGFWNNGPSNPFDTIAKAA